MEALQVREGVGGALCVWEREAGVEKVALQVSLLAHAGSGLKPCTRPWGRGWLSQAIFGGHSWPAGRGLLRKSALPSCPSPQCWHHCRQTPQVCQLALPVCNECQPSCCTAQHMQQQQWVTRSGVL